MITLSDESRQRMELVLNEMLEEQKKLADAITTIQTFLTAVISNSNSNGNIKPSETRICSQCRTEKTTNFFRRVGRGYASICRACERKDGVTT